MSTRLQRNLQVIRAAQQDWDRVGRGMRSLAAPGGKSQPKDGPSRGSRSASQSLAAPRGWGPPQGQGRARGSRAMSPSIAAGLAGTHRGGHLGRLPAQHQQQRGQHQPRAPPRPHPAAARGSSRRAPSSPVPSALRAGRLPLRLAWPAGKRRAPPAQQLGMGGRGARPLCSQGCCCFPPPPPPPGGPALASPRTQRPGAWSGARLGGGSGRVSAGRGRGRGVMPLQVAGVPITLRGPCPCALFPGTGSKRVLGAGLSKLPPHGWI